ESHRIFIADLYDRVIALALDGTTRSLRMAPICTRHIAPPLRIIIQVHGAVGTDKDHGARHQYIVRRRRNARRQLYADGFPVGLLLGGGDIARLRDKLRELVVGNVGDVYPEAIKLHRVGWPLVDLS